MSNEIYGFGEFIDVPDSLILLKALGSLTPLGVFSASKDCLFEFPIDLRPSSGAFVFIIGDSGDSMDAEHLLDNRDYDPRSAIELPINANERLSLLVRALSFYLIIFNAHGLLSA